MQVTKPTGGVDFFESHDFLAGSGYAWCVSTFLTAWAVGANHPLPYKTAGAFDFLDHYTRIGWRVPVQKAIPGDAIIFNVGSGHLACLEQPVGSSGSRVHTIDGNHGDRVARATRSVHLVRGAIHIPEVHNVQPPAKIPWSVTVTSSNGHVQRVLTTRCTKAAFLKYVLPPLISKYGKAAITIRRAKKKGTH